MLLFAVRQIALTDEDYERNLGQVADNLRRLKVLLAADDCNRSRLASRVVAVDVGQLLRDAKR